MKTLFALVLVLLSLSPSLAQAADCTLADAVKKARSLNLIMSNDMVRIIATTAPELKMTRYRALSNGSNGGAEATLELQGPGFKCVKSYKMAHAEIQVPYAMFGDAEKEPLLRFLQSCVVMLGKGKGVATLGFTAINTKMLSDVLSYSSENSAESAVSILISLGNANLGGFGCY